MTLAPKSAFDLVTATEWNELLRLSTPLYARRTANDTYALTTPLKSDPTLILTPDINAVHTFTAWLVVTAPAAQDFKFQWAVPASSTGWWTVKNTALATGAGTVFQSPLTWGSSAVMEGAGGDIVLECFGTLITAGVAGSFQLQYAPNTAGTVTIQTSSSIELRKR